MSVHPSRISEEVFLLRMKFGMYVDFCRGRFCLDRFLIFVLVRCHDVQTYCVPPLVKKFCLLPAVDSPVWSWFFKIILALFVVDSIYVLNSWARETLSNCTRGTTLAACSFLQLLFKMWVFFCVEYRLRFWHKADRHERMSGWLISYLWTVSLLCLSFF